MIDSGLLSHSRVKYCIEIFAVMTEADEDLGTSFLVTIHELGVNGLWSSVKQVVIQQTS